MLTLALYVCLPTCITRIPTHIYWMLPPHCGLQNSPMFRIIDICHPLKHLNKCMKSIICFYFGISNCIIDLITRFSNTISTNANHASIELVSKVVTNPNWATLVVYWYVQYEHCKNPEGIRFETLGVFFFSKKSYYISIRKRHKAKHTRYTIRLNMLLVYKIYQEFYFMILNIRYF